MVQQIAGGYPARDKYLQNLAIEVCRHPTGSPERQKALNRLISYLQRLPELLHSNHPDYLEALNRTWEWFSKNICRTFKPLRDSFQKSLAIWINGYLYWRIRDLTSPQLHLSLDAVIRGSDSLETHLDQLPKDPKALTLSGLDMYLARLENHQLQTLVSQLENYIEQDPDNRLKRCHPRNYPNCHCQFLAQRLLLKNPPDRLACISRELGINDRTLRSHWKNRCLPLLQTITQELGYSPY